ncbi:MAG: hypothetical protein Q9221_004199 [Calogaya cf. arnoldii]
MTITKNAADLDRQFSEKAPFMFASRMGLPDCHPVIGPELDTNFHSESLACKDCSLRAHTRTQDAWTSFPGQYYGQTISLNVSSVIVTAYDVHTVFSVEGLSMEGVSEPYCLTDVDLGIGLVRELTVTHPRPILGSEFSSLVATLLASFLGLGKCRLDIGTATNDVPRMKAITATASETNIMTANNPSPDRRLSAGVKVAIVLAILFTALFIIIAMLVGLKRYRKRKREHEHRSTDPTTASENDQPYLQQKAELEAEESGKFELHGDDHKCELQGSEVREMLTDANARDLNVAPEIE